MAGVWMQAKSELRARLRSIVVLGLLFGLFCSVVLAAVAGARRTGTALRRSIAETEIADALVGNDLSEGLQSRIEALPQVRDHGRVSFLLFAPEASPGVPGSAFGVTVIMPDDERWPREFDRARILRGRMPSVSDPHEIIINEPMSKTHGLTVGDEPLFFTYASSQLFEIFQGKSPVPSGPKLRMRVVGIARHVRDLPLGSDVAQAGIVIGSPAFLGRYPGRIANFGTNSFVQLERGVDDLPAFRSAADRLRKEIGGPEDELAVESTHEFIQPARDALSVQTIALWLFAIAAALAVLLVTGQSIARLVTIAGDDSPVLASMGMTRTERVAAVMFPVGVIAMLGAVIAVPVAFGLSSLFPNGFGRLAEPDPGLRFDPLALVGGALVAVVLLLVRIAPVAWRAAAGAPQRVRSGGERASRLAATLGRAGGSAASVTGVRMAVEPGRGKTSVPVRAAAASAIAGLAAITASFTIWASLQNIVQTPRLYGWNWDVAISGPDSPELVPEMVAKLERDPGIDAVSTAVLTDVRLNGRTTQAYAITPVRGDVFLSMVEGRRPKTAEEIVLGRATMEALDVGIGDTVDVAPEGGGSGTFAMKVVGRGIFPGVDTEPLGDGAGFTGEAFEEIGSDPDFIDAFAQLRPGSDHDEELKRLRSSFGETNAFLPFRPASVENLSRVTPVPLMLGALMIVLAIATIAHALVTTTRRRSVDFAILKTLGFSRSQVKGAVAWQATTFGMVAVMVGIPVGLAAGRWGWRILANRIGVPLETVSPAWLFLAVPAMLLLVNLVSVFPARAAAGMRPALLLRTE